MCEFLCAELCFKFSVGGCLRNEGGCFDDMWRRVTKTRRVWWFGFEIREVEANDVLPPYCF